MVWPFRREAKANPVGGALMVPTGAGWSRATDRRAYIRDGYQLNAVIYRAIREIVLAASGIKIELHRGDTLVERHPILDLLARPNPMQAWGQFLAETLIDRQLFGEQAIVGAGGPRFAELWPVRPIDVEIAPGAGGMPRRYEFKKNGTALSFDVDPATGASDMFFAKLHNPDDYWRGQSPLMAAGLAGDTHNAGMRWNYSLLRNGARPSGLIKFEGDPGEQTLARLREWFKKSMTGASNAGEIPMLVEGAEWVQIDQSPRDMDYLSTMKEAAKLIASALGVPLPLIDNDASTFNNLEQAKERFYTDTVIPMMLDFLGALSNWLAPRWGEDFRLGMDMDSIPALEAMRQRKFDRAVKAKQAGVLTVNEAREMLGYDAIAGGDVLAAQTPPPDEPKAMDLARLAYG